MLGVDRKAASYTWSAVLVVLLLALIYWTRETLIVFVIALLFAYLLYPIVDLLDRLTPTRSRTLALAVVYLALIGVLVMLGIGIGSKVAEQASSLAIRAPDFVKKMQQEPSPVPLPQSVKSIKATILGAIEGQLRQHYSQLMSAVPQVTLKVLSASRNLIFVVIVPILSFFFLKDGRTIRDELLELIEPGHPRELVEDIMGDVHKLLLQYMRALFFLCMCTLVVFSIVFSVMGVPYGILLASIAFPLEFIPLVGPLAAGAIIIGVVAFSGFPHLLWVVIFLLVFRMFQDYVLSPNLMSAGIELHPLLVIFGVFAGGEIGGIAGTFLSVPVLAFLRILYHRIRKSRVARAPSLVTT